MNHDFAAAMGRALGQTRAGDPAEATRTIQAALAGRTAPGHGCGPDVRPISWRPERTGADGVVDAEVINDGEVFDPAHRLAPAESGRLAPRKRRRPLGEVVDILSRGQRGRMPTKAPGVQTRTPPAVPQGARYERRMFASAAGSRSYSLYAPSALPEGPQGLVLMLHGCTQDADDFALGAGMNRVAERHGLIVAYPEEARVHNAQACWNWFRPADQGRDRGEPEILAGLARALRAEFGVEPGRVFAAGLSAGGGMAAILGVTHPEVFSAIGVHSGLPHGAAHDVVSAFAAMRGEAASGPARRARRGPSGPSCSTAAPMRRCIPRTPIASFRRPRRDRA